VTKRVFAVIGDPIEHSLSPLIHERFAKQCGLSLTYKKILGHPKDFEQQVRTFFKEGGSGLNVTAPFKQRAFAMAKVRSTRCEMAGAANTLWMHNKTLCADNTDGVGFLSDLLRYFNPCGQAVLLVGAGGAARGILGPLLETRPAELVLSNRTMDKAQALHQLFPEIKTRAFESIKGNFDLVIHACPNGSTPQLPRAFLSEKTFCYDLSYAPHAKTAFVTFAQSQGCKAQDGLGMLVEQAAESFYLWHGVRPLSEPVIDFLHH
jgi:shikimate dehydrogenase